MTKYLHWKQQLTEYWEHNAKKRRRCTTDGCGRIQRAKGFCRHHYFKHFRK